MYNLYLSIKSDHNNIIVTVITLVLLYSIVITVSLLWCSIDMYYISVKTTVKLL